MPNVIIDMMAGYFKTCPNVLLVTDLPLAMLEGRM